jgi:hypothetical protein
MGMFGSGVATGMENIPRIQSTIPQAQKKAITKWYGAVAMTAIGHFVDLENVGVLTRI